jgi:hypothetical protein
LSSILMAFVDSPNSASRPRRCDRVQLLRKNFLSNLTLVCDVIRLPIMMASMSNKFTRFLQELQEIYYKTKIGFCLRRIFKPQTFNLKPLSPLPIHQIIPALCHNRFVNQLQEYIFVNKMWD